MARELKAVRVAVLAASGFEHSELVEPVAALGRAGAAVEAVAPEVGEIQGWRHHDRAETMARGR